MSQNDFALSFNAFCKFFTRYRVDNLYKNVKGSHIGSFKSKNQQAYEILNEIVDIELQKENISKFIVQLVQHSLSTDNNDCFTEHTYVLIEDCSHNDFKFCNIQGNEWLQEEVELFHRFLSKANSFFNSDNNASFDNHIRELENDHTNDISRTDPPIASTQLDYSLLASSITNDKSFVEFMKAMHDSYSNSIDKKISNSIDRHMSFSRELTSEQLEEYKKKCVYIIEKVLRKRNDIEVYKTHIKNGTAPEQLSHKRFPMPLLHDDELTVNKYNDLISKWQTEAMELYMRRLNEQIHICENDIKLYSEIILRNSNENEEFLKYSWENSEKKLQKEFVKSNDKCLNITISKYTVKRQQPHHHQYDHKQQHQRHQSQNSAKNQNKHHSSNYKNNFKKNTHKPYNENNPNHSKVINNNLNQRQGINNNLSMNQHKKPKSNSYDQNTSNKQVFDKRRKTTKNS